MDLRVTRPGAAQRVVVGLGDRRILGGILDAQPPVSWAARTGGVLMRAHHRRVDRGQRPSRRRSPSSAQCRRSSSIFAEAPSNESAVVFPNRLPRAEIGGQIPPRRTGTEPPRDPLQHELMIGPTGVPRRPTSEGISGSTAAQPAIGNHSHSIRRQPPRTAAAQHPKSFGQHGLSRRLRSITCRTAELRVVFQPDAHTSLGQYAWTLPGPWSLSRV